MSIPQTVPPGQSSTASVSASRDNEYHIDDGLLLQLKFKAIEAKGAAYCMYSSIYLV